MINMDPEIQKKRDKLLGFLGSFFRRSNVQVTNEMPDESTTILVTAVEDFDPKSNELWLIPANKSYPRDEVCATCGRQVVMSDGMYAGYVGGQREATLKCGRCVIKLIGKYEK